MPGIPISQKPRIARKSVMLDILGQRRLCHFLLFYVVLRPAVHRETPQRRQIQDGMETDFLKEQAPVAVRCRCGRSGTAATTAYVRVGGYQRGIASWRERECKEGR